MKWCIIHIHCWNSFHEIKALPLCIKYHSRAIFKSSTRINLGTISWRIVLPGRNGCINAIVQKLREKGQKLKILIVIKKPCCGPEPDFKKLCDLKLVTVSKSHVFNEKKIKKFGLYGFWWHKYFPIARLYKRCSSNTFPWCYLIQ